ncbi:MAG: hypothetical protein AB3N28_11350 [Kordiimonas sp.]
MIKTHRYLSLSLAVLLAALFTRWVQAEDHRGFSFIVVADTAYQVPQDYDVYDKLIETMNVEAPAFTIHLGDVFSGATDCGEKHISRVVRDFKKYAHPVVYTPGDNEWTDCHRPEAGGYEPTERLENIRKLFFAKPAVLGKGSLQFKRQGNLGGFMAENIQWQHDDVLFATAHIVGSNNGLSDVVEYSARNKANLRWIEEVFKQATKVKSEAIVLAYHANMFAKPETPDGFGELRALIGRLGEQFGKPVLLVHGDHHQFEIDRPYLPKLQKGPGANIVRLQTYGWPDAKAVKINVDTSRSGVFSFQPVYVGNGLY